MDFYDGATRYSAVGLSPGNSSAINLQSLKGGTGGGMVSLAAGTAFSAGVSWLMGIQDVYESVS
jgi:hypothetical protein